MMFDFPAAKIRFFVKCELQSADNVLQLEISNKKNGTKESFAPSLYRQMSVT